MRRNKVYTVNKYNKNLFDGGGWFKKFAATDVGKATIGAGSAAIGLGLGSVISGGLNSGAGSAITNIGSTIGGAISLVNPVIGGIVSGVSGLVGGGVNALFGSNLNQKNISRIQAANENLARTLLDDSSNASVLAGASNINFGGDFTRKDVGKLGLFSHKATNKFNELQAQRNAAIGLALSAIGLAASNAADIQNQNIMANFSAYGGPLDFMNWDGAIGYDFMNRYLLDKEEGELNDKIASMPNSFKDGGGIYIKPSKRGTFTAAAKKRGMGVLEFASKVLANKEDYSPAMVNKITKTPNLFSDGGTMHNGDFTNGVIYINEGGSHSENPYGGVLIGKDQENVPNLVEEGEVIFNDYVFSKRLKVPKKFKEDFKLKDDISTFADAAKEMSKESEERPNDPISQNGLEAALANLAASQEGIRAKKQANLFNNGGNLFETGGKEDIIYGINPLNFSNKDRDFDTLYAEGSDYRTRRDYILNNWDSDYVQNWLKNVYAPSVTDYNKSRGYKGLFTVTKDLFKRGSLDRKWGAMHQGILDFNLPNLNNAKSPFPSVMYMDTDRNLFESLLEGQSPLITSKQALTGLSGVSKGTAVIPMQPLTTPTFAAPFAPDINNVEISYMGTKDTWKPRPTWMMGAPIIGSALGLTLSLLTPADYSNADRIEAAARLAGRFTPIGYTPIGNYLTYNPLDIQYQTNLLNAQAGATRRALQQQAVGNAGAAMAGLIGQDYASQAALGDAYRQAAIANQQQLQQIESFNRATNQANAEMALKADMANLEAESKARQLGLRGISTAAQMRESIGQARANSIAANLSNLFTNIGNLGRLNAALNLNDMLYHSGYYGTGNEYTDAMINRGLWPRRRTAAKGGKLNKKGGRHA